MTESAPTEVLVGLDIGGTKAAVIVEDLHGRRFVETAVPSEDWDAHPADAGARWVSALLGRVLPADAMIAALGIGAQGLDAPEHTADFTRELRALGHPTIAVNDAALLVPAAGFDSGLGVIAGTGAVGVGLDAFGAAVITGGWGWVLGDEAGAAGIVREATKAALLAHDDGADDDGLLCALLAAFAVDDVERLARVVNDEPTMDNWGPRAPAVFSAADAGSALAVAVVQGAAEHLALLVTQLLNRGAVGSHIVAAGSVIVNQPRLLDAFRGLVAGRHPELSVTLLTEPPVVGALALARRLLATT